ncbi:MAG: hypothetical protein AAGL66_10735 [Pseudomonadota bacterium]
MKQFLSLSYSLEGLAALVSVVAGVGVLHTFVLGKHFVIPTLILLLVILFGNLARFGLKDQRWAKHMLFWIFLLAVLHALFAVVWARDARPGQLLGEAFYPLYGGFVLGVGTLCFLYAKRNALFGR